MSDVTNAENSVLGARKCSVSFLLIQYSTVVLTYLGITDTRTYLLPRVLCVDGPFSKNSVYCSTQSQVWRATCGFALMHFKIKCLNNKHCSPITRDTGTGLGNCGEAAS